jgi:hypothetical protein
MPWDQGPGFHAGVFRWKHARATPRYSERNVEPAATILVTQFPAPMIVRERPRCRGRNERAGVGLISAGCLLRWSIAMPRTGWSPTTIPYGADQKVHLALTVSAAAPFTARPKSSCADLETIISDFLIGQFNDRVRVVAFNTLAHWADDVSEDVAQEMQARCDIAGEPVSGGECNGISAQETRGLSRSFWQRLRPR